MHLSLVGHSYTFPFFGFSYKATKQPALNIGWPLGYQVSGLHLKGMIRFKLSFRPGERRGGGGGGGGLAFVVHFAWDG